MILGSIALLSMSQRFHIDHIPKVLETALQGCKEIKVNIRVYNTYKFFLRY